MDRYLAEVFLWLTNSNVFRSKYCKYGAVTKASLKVS